MKKILALLLVLTMVLSLTACGERASSIKDDASAGWETEAIEDLTILKNEFERLHVDAWCDFWGYDVNHDWPWWFKQMRYFIPIILERWGMQ